jgi:hypothetical protein
MNAGAPALATALHPAKVVPSSLVTPAEVGRVLGSPATLTGGGADRALAVGPVALATYQAADGSSLILGVVTGAAAELAIRAHRGGRLVAGVGDEAFASGQWVVARRGTVAVTVEQRSRGPVHQPYLVWLLGLAINRLT